MTYQQTLDYLFSQLPMFSRIGGAAIKKDITNTVKLCSYLGNPQEKFKSVHIAGTNGKGSTSHMLAAIFQTAGYKTGLYTSPHLRDFRERIKVNGEMIPEENVVDFTERMKEQIAVIEPSFFEITVAMAFEYFAAEEVDIAIVETGLGGRLDSTNIVSPEISIITNIGWDHMNILGDSLEKIATEKAGIIKREIPVVIGEFDAQVSHVFDKTAAALQAPITYANRKFALTEFRFEKHELVAEVSRLNSDEKNYYHLDLGGLYQGKNLVTVLEAVNQLKQKGWKLSDQHITKALRQVKKLTGLHGRWELIHEHPRVVLDVAHNADGIKQVSAQLELTTYHRLHIIIGMVKDKEVKEVLELLPKTATYYFTKAQIPRALPESDLQQLGEAAGLKGHHYTDVNTAIRAAMAEAGHDDLLLICGSVFVAGEVASKAFQPAISTGNV
jgi:dihydrofolate synthase / folylpolyglutamate synthase